MLEPKILIYDIETAPIIAHVWTLWQNDVGLNQIEKDWHLLSWSAKWLGKKKVMYMDQRNASDISNDKKLCMGIHKLLDEADIVVTQNGKRFDEKKLNARFILNGLKPPSTYKHIDTRQIAKQKFGFTSNKLEYMTHNLNTKYKKLTGRKKFPGHSLWSECLKGNLAAWKEMEKYNKYDVLSLEELYLILEPWHKSIDFNIYRSNSGEEYICNCGSKELVKNGYHRSTVSVFQRYKCRKCGANIAGRDNLLDKSTKPKLGRI